ncbi:hypothetical protein Daudx_0470 [Candidatus Desulforudis audaxviator]|nr:hypothetical protein Daudx_0470 [Candidatus Desulforudis audaxviator]
MALAHIPDLAELAKQKKRQDYLLVSAQEKNCTNKFPLTVPVPLTIQ